MNYRAFIVLGALLAAGLTACDPYEEEDGGAPTVIGAVLTNGATPAVDMEPGDGLSLTGVPLDPEDETPQNVLHVLTSGSLDAASVQTALNDCTPANGWLTVTGPAITCEAGTPAWYSCYQPASPEPGQGASIVVFQSCEAITPDFGWYEAAGLVPGATYTVSGNVRAAGGAEFPINVTFIAAEEFVPPPPAT